MKAGEAQAYLQSVQADIAQESDPALRGWYETEMSLTPEYREAAELQQLLGRLGTGIGELAKQREAGQAAPEDQAAQPDITPEDFVDDDEYLTPAERKQKSVLTWLEVVLDDYGQDAKAAQRETKKSKREKGLSIAANRFGRRFEQFGPNSQHIVHDPEALEYALEALFEQQPNLAASVVKSSETYMHKNGVDFSDNHNAFANIVVRSYDNTPAGDAFYKIFTAIYDKKSFVANPLDAARLHVNLAHTLFEDVDLTRAVDPILETAYLQNDIIRDAAGYISAVQSVILLGPVAQIGGDVMNAKQVFYQSLSTYKQTIGGELHRKQLAHYQSELARRSMDALADEFRPLLGDGDIDKLLTDRSDKKFLTHPQHFDPLYVFNTTTGEELETELGQPIPEEFAHFYTASSLYEKRIRHLAPLSLAHEIILNIMKESDVASPLSECAISPGISATLAVFVKGPRENDGKLDFDSAFNGAIRPALAGICDRGGLDMVRHKPGQPIPIGLRMIGFEVGANKIGAIVAVRPSGPMDLKMADPHLGLIAGLGFIEGDLEDRAQVEARVAEAKQQIRDNQHNYPGRRPLKFRLPDQYRQRGLNSIEMRQHPDRRNLIVTTKHDDGEIEFTFDQNFETNILTTAEASQVDDLQLALKSLVVSLYREWACRPVIETSEGTVTAEEGGKKVNLGFLRYLPENQNFTSRQADIFKKEQHGNLATESLRRKPLDPTGLSRNSTYVRENYDPSMPALEIYYDPEVIS